MLLVQRATLAANRRVAMPLLRAADVILKPGESEGDSSDAVLSFKPKQQVLVGHLASASPGQPVCVKRVPLVDSALAWNEAEVLAQLAPWQCPYLPKFHGAAHDDAGNLLVVRELLSSSSMFRPVHLLHIASAVQCMHRAGLCHRDIKLANVMMSSSTGDDAVAKLMDFDRSVPLDLLDVEPPVGTVTHMAPELHCWERPYSTKLDSYAFGITMFELLHPTHAGAPYPDYADPASMPGTLSSTELTKQVVDGKRRPKWEHPSATLKLLAERCWSDSPAARPDFDEIVAVLSEEFGQEAASSSPAAPAAVPLPKPPTMQTIGSHTSIGHVRTTMEDASCFLVTPDFTLLGAFDGLRSHHTSSFASRIFPLLYVDSLKKTFADTDALLERTQYECGSTATVVVVSEKTIKAGWLGDSSAYLFTKTKLTPVRYQVKDLIVKHAPEREDEKFRIEQCGGEVRRDQRVMDDGSQMSVGPWRAVPPATAAARSVGIAISRALGLFKFRPVISPQPEFITVARRAEDRFLVVATDGLWDLVGLNEVLKVLRESNGDAELASKDLVNLALDRGAHDNVSVVVAMM